MKRNYLAFDIETAKILPKDVQDLKAHRPLGIACAATLFSLDDQPRLWYSKSNEDTPTNRMSREDASDLVRFLTESTKNGLTVLTWNGLNFDFDILAEESGMVDECRRLAIRHVDMMFHAFCQLGYPIGLDPASRGMGLSGKSSSVPQNLSPQFWADGKFNEVFEYVSQDVRATLELALACEKKRVFRWVTRKGSVRDMPFASGWMNVESAMRLPEPDTSWMDNPKPRSKYIDWL
jgi:RNase_H superfamily